MRSIDPQLVQELVAGQFPRWAGLPVRPMPHAGWDNRSFRLGESMVARLPSSEAYAGQVDKEQRWLPFLAPRLSHAIPEPLAMGEPGTGYPWRWSIYRFIEGERPGAPGEDREALARDLADFLDTLHRIDARGGPAPGDHNFQRGAPLSHYDKEARSAIDILGLRIRADAAVATWEAALHAAPWKRSRVWVHGDIAPGNLLMREGRLAAVIDFGNLAVGDPACDLAIAWTWFDEPAREAFRTRMAFDDDTWSRARGWALWKALIVAAGLSPTNAPEYARPLEALDAALAP